MLEPTTTMDDADPPASGSAGISKRPVDVPLSPIIEAPVTRLSVADEGHESSGATPVLPAGSISSIDAPFPPMVRARILDSAIIHFLVLTRVLLSP